MTHIVIPSMYVLVLTSSNYDDSVMMSDRDVSRLLRDEMDVGCLRLPLAGDGIWPAG